MTALRANDLPCEPTYLHLFSLICPLIDPRHSSLVLFTTARAFTALLAGTFNLLHSLTLHDCHIAHLLRHAHHNRASLWVAGLLANLAANVDDAEAATVCVLLVGGGAHRGVGGFGKGDELLDW